MNLKKKVVNITMYNLKFFKIKVYQVFHHYLQPKWSYLYKMYIKYSIAMYNLEIFVCVKSI